MQAFTNKVGLVLAAGFVLTACGGGSDGSSGASSLVRVSSESAGANCAAGGQRLLAGSDSNADDQLQDSEVQLTTFACNGPSAQVHFDVARIAVGDLRCPDGGNLVSITSGSSAVAQPLALCDGAIGAAGSAGESGASGNAGSAGPVGSSGSAGPTGPAGSVGSEGAAGATGPVGPDGPAATDPLPALASRFYLQQVVRGGTLTCTSADADSSVTTCVDLRINGDYIPLATVANDVICAAITGKPFVSQGGDIIGLTGYSSWNGSAWQHEGSKGGASSYLRSLACLR
jgi:hypothetical protein